MYNYNKNLVARDFNRAASRYDEHAHLQQRAVHDLLALAEGVFPSGAEMLDLGCGTGCLARHAPSTWAITQLDIAGGMCRRASDAGATVQGDMENLPFAEGTFGGAVSSLALQWTNPEAVFAEVSRVLKPGGVAAFATLGPQTFQELRGVLAEVTGTPRTSSFPDRAYLEQALQSAGLTLMLWQESLTREAWPDALALMRGIKAMGAANKGEDRFRALTEKALRTAADRYRQDYPAPGGVYATWQVWLFLAAKS